MTRRCAGQWQAYVAQGASHKERRARLAEVPESLRALVDDHVRTVFALRKKAAEEQAERKKNDYGNRRAAQWVNA